MVNNKKINLICVGGVGESFIQFLESDISKQVQFNTQILNSSDGKSEKIDLESYNYATSIFCLVGASSTINILKIKSIFDHNPTLWQRTHFILVHPFNFEGEERAKTAKDFSEFVSSQGSKKTDFRNQDLFKHIDQNAKFEDGYEIMNQWILSEIKPKEDY